jgi:hypothetical protein
LELLVKIQVIWDDDEKTIIRFIVEAHWTWDEFVTAQQVAYELAYTVPHKVGIVIPEAGTLPPEARSGRKDFTFLTNRHPNVDIFVLVVQVALIRGMIGLLMKLYSPAASLVVVVSTLEEARSLIKGRLQAAS